LATGSRQVPGKHKVKTYQTKTSNKKTRGLRAAYIPIARMVTPWFQ
jgi:hypothetical protein